MNIDVSENAIIERAAEKIADELVDSDQLVNLVHRKIETRLDQLFGEKMQAKVEQQIEKEMLRIVEQEIQPVNIWGETTGKKTTIRDEVVKQSKDYWETVVDPKTGNPWSYTYKPRESMTRAQYLVRQITQEDTAEIVRETISESINPFKQAIRDSLNSEIKNVIENVFSDK